MLDASDCEGIGEVCSEYTVEQVQLGTWQVVVCVDCFFLQVLPEWTVVLFCPGAFSEVGLNFLTESLKSK